MERYLLFAWKGYPQGGHSDFIDSFASFNDAIDYPVDFEGYYNYQIIDTKHMEVLREGVSNTIQVN